MEKIKQYELTVCRAADISEVFLDMEGGRYALALLNELLQEMLAAGNIPGAVAIAEKLHESADIPFDIYEERAGILEWISILSESIDDLLE